MVKNWLIRTLEYEIKGPVTKERVIELIKDGTLREEDEISSGNGYWFWIKEKDLLEKYLYGTEEQSFYLLNNFDGQQGHYEEGILPDNKDLEYPEGDEEARVIEEAAASCMVVDRESLSAPDVEEEKVVEDVGSIEDSESQEENLPSEKSEKFLSLKPEWGSFIKTFLATIVIIIVLLVVFEKVFKYPVLQWIFPSVNAQERLAGNSPAIGFHNLFAGRGINGFIIMAKSKEMPKDCWQTKNYFMGVMMLLNKRNGASEEGQFFMRRCAAIIPKDIQAMLNLPDNINLVQLKKYLKNMNFSSREQVAIVNIHRLVEQQKKDSAILGKFLVYEREKKKTFSKNKIFWNGCKILNPVLFEMS